MACKELNARRDTIGREFGDALTKEESNWWVREGEVRWLEAPPILLVTRYGLLSCCDGCSFVGVVEAAWGDVACLRLLPRQPKASRGS